MSPKRSDYHQLRANIPKSSYSLLKRLAGVREVTLSDLVTIAVDQFLESEEIQEEIRFHRLDSSNESE
jgi:hypothetical protein